MKIKEAGYKWDTENKELKKIEQKPAETLLTLDEAIAHCKEKSCGDSACASQHKQLAEWLTELKELKEQKPAWSEEDERMFTLCASSVQTRYNEGLLTYNEYEQASLWLKSLKQRMKGE